MSMVYFSGKFRVLLVCIVIGVAGAIIYLSSGRKPAADSADSANATGRPVVTDGKGEPSAK